MAATSVVIGAAVTPDQAPSLSAMDQPTPTQTSAAVAAMATTSSVAPTSTTTTNTSAAPSPYPSDEYGFVDSNARCDDSQLVMAFGRTERSLVAICVDTAGAYEYRGVRLSDGAELTVGGVEAQSDGEFVARADGIAYVVSEQEFYLMSGSEVTREEAWLEYHEPALAAEAAPPSSSDTEASSTATPSTATSVRPSSIAPETFEPVR